MTWAQILPPVIFLLLSAYLWVRYRELRRWARKAKAELGQEEERLVGSLALAEETVHRILLSAEIEATLSRMAVDCVELLDLAGVRIHLDVEVVPGVAGSRARAEHGSCEGENTQRLPVRVQEREIGSFWFTPRADRPLRSRELHFLRLMAVLVGIGVENMLFHRQVAAANEDKSRFVLATTHDLRSPMTTVEQLTQVMLEGYAGELAPKQRELLEKIKGQSAHQLQLIADLLALAAEENALSVPREPTTVSLAEVFDAQVEATRAGCEGKQITLEASRDEAAMIRTAVKGDMENIFGNLLSNAVKYTKEGGRITASLHPEGKGYRLKVEDTGIGIPKEAMPNLFREYFRAPNAREVTRHGTGLGLALVQKLVVKYGGKIRVNSRLNEGSTFEVFLPAED
jgi:two-component system, OmpR family, phosphate regulon sensor histidine kinase PhoR